MTPEMQMELIAALEDAAPSDCRVLVLTGAGDAFCSGLDLSALQAMQDKSATEHRADAERIARLFLTLYELAHADHRCGPWRGNRRRNGIGHDLRLHARNAGRKVWIHRSAHRLCSRAGVGFSGIADRRQAEPRSAVDWPEFSMQQRRIASAS